MDPSAQALEMLRQATSSPAPASNIAMIRKLVATEYTRLECPAAINFIGNAERDLFEHHQDKV